MIVLKWPLRIILIPIVLVFRLVILLLTLVISLSSTLLGVVSGLLGLVAVVVALTDKWENGACLLVIAWLVSPAGLPLLAVWLMSRLVAVQDWLCDKVYH